MVSRKAAQLAPESASPESIPPPPKRKYVPPGGGTKRLRGKFLWEGPSQLDGKPIVLLATWQAAHLHNQKTGAMIQTWILRADVSALDALKTGADASICGDCKMRPQAQDGTLSDRACYVYPGKVWNIWRAHQRRAYGDLDLSPRPFAGKEVRVGSYGDPIAVPIEVWSRVLDGAEFWTGYTHQWRRKGIDPAFQSMLMASCDSPADFDHAESLGWRTFRARLPNEPLLKNEIVCPASKEGGHKAQCIDCRLCDGMKGGHDKRKSIAIIAHGFNPNVYAYKKLRGLPVIK